MDTSPAQVRMTSFRTAKKGYDAAEVDAFVSRIADALEAAQNETTAMEARARAAVARLQELAQAGDSGAAELGGDEPAREITPDESETISRTLLLAQRTADAAVAEASAEADRVLSAARDEAAAHLDAARAQTSEMLEEARGEARRAGEDERVQAESEVQSLLARRDFLEADVDHLEQFLEAQRERIAEAAAALNEIVTRGPGGIGEMRRPLLSAADDGASRADDDLVSSADDLEDTGPIEIVDAGPGSGATEQATDDDERWAQPADAGDREAEAQPAATTETAGRDLYR